MVWVGPESVIEIWIDGGRGARCITRPPAKDERKETVMALPFCKSSFYRAAILLWFSASLAELMLGPLPIISQTAVPSRSQGASRTQQEHDKMIAETADRSASDAQSNEQSSQSSPAGKRDRAILKANLEKMNRDAGELADLAKALQEELNKSNENLLPLGVVEKAGKIEKLAKKIKGAARGF